MTKPISKEKFLELENLNLKLHIMKRNTQDWEKKVQVSAQALFDSEGLDPNDWVIDLDHGVFVQKNQQSTS